MLAPICLFTYNRLNETARTVKALKENFLAEQSDLYIFSDAPRNESVRDQVNNVRGYLRTITGFRSIKIILSEKNLGLANSIINGVSKVISEYGKVIVLEDDLATQPNFLEFMNQSLDYFENNKAVYTINGFSLNVGCNVQYYFQTRPFPWGWATWKDRWNLEFFDKSKIRKLLDDDRSLIRLFRKECGDDVEKMLLDSISNRNDSWYIRWTFAHFLNNKVSLYPAKSLVTNTGFTSEGTNCKTINPYRSMLDDSRKLNMCFNDNILVNDKTRKAFLKYFSKKYRLTIRLKMLTSLSGAKLLYKDIKEKLK